MTAPWTVGDDPLARGRDVVLSGDVNPDVLSEDDVRRGRRRSRVEEDEDQEAAFSEAELIDAPAKIPAPTGDAEAPGAATAAAITGVVHAAAIAVRRATPGGIDGSRSSLGEWC